MGDYVKRSRGSHCRDEHERERDANRTPAGNIPEGVWRCSCGKAWRVFMGMPQWRVRRYDAHAKRRLIGGDEGA